jgi:hypothetical protein
MVFRVAVSRAKSYARYVALHGKLDISMGMQILPLVYGTNELDKELWKIEGEEASRLHASCK